VPSASNARISRSHGSWRVRIPGYAPKFFADETYGGTVKALRMARAWRDARWDGSDRGRKLTPAERVAIARSDEHYVDIAARYGISPNYVHVLRREG
jgi:hypothetical protein